MESYSKNELSVGLQRLATEIDCSPIFASIKPIRLVASGDYVSLMAFGASAPVAVIDYFHDLGVFGGGVLGGGELKILMCKVAFELGYEGFWCYDLAEATPFLASQTKRVFDQSVNQAMILFESRPLIVYAAFANFGLVQLLNKIENCDHSLEDWINCLGWLDLMDQNGSLPLTKAQLKESVDLEVPKLPKTFEKVNQMYFTKAKKVAITDDPEAEKERNDENEE